MGQGSQSRGLRVANRTQYGIDGTKVLNPDGSVAWDIGNFEAEAGIKNRAGTGKLPRAKDDNPVLEERVSFKTPDVSRETKNRATKSGREK